MAADDWSNSWTERLIVRVYSIGLRALLICLDLLNAVLLPFGYSIADWQASYSSVLRTWSQWNLAERTGQRDEPLARDTLDPPSWLEGFQTYMRACGKASSLPASGRWLALTTIRMSAEGRLKVLRQIRLHPEILQVPITSPVFIISPPRTGTTLLHRLLALDENNRTFCPWELLALPDFGEMKRETLKRNGVRVARAAIQALTSHLAAKHYSDPLQPEECSVGLMQRCGYDAMVFLTLHHNEELKRQREQLINNIEKQEEMYLFYKQQLQLALHHDAGYQSSRTGCNSKRLVMKCPSHALFLRGLAKVFPDAWFINLIRSPEETIPSLASLCSSIGHLYGSRSPDLKSFGNLALQDTSRMVKNVRELKADSAFATQIIDVRYTQLVSNPTETIRSIYAHLQISNDLEAQFKEDIGQYTSNNPARKHGQHRYSMEQFGLSKEKIRRELDGFYKEYDFGK